MAGIHCLDRILAEGVLDTSAELALRDIVEELKGIRAAIEYSNEHCIPGYQPAIREAVRKILAPWVNGSIGFNEWCEAVDRIFPPKG